MVQKIIGIVGALAVVGVIVMVAVSPKAEGFFPGMFDLMKRAPAVVETVPQATPPEVIPVDTLPAAYVEPIADTVVTEIMQ